MQVSKLETLAGAEHQLAVGQEKVKFAADVAKLLENPLFKRVILDEYIIQESARFVQQSCDPMYDAQQRADALAMAQAGGHLKRWLTATQQQAEQIVTRLPEIQEEIELLRAEIEAGEEDEE